MSIKQRNGHRDPEAGGVQARLLATIFGLLVLLGVGVGTNVEFQRVGSIKSTLAEGAKRVSDSIRVNGCVTQTDQTNISNYLSTNGLDPSQVYFDASTSRQSYGSTVGNGAVGYNFPIKVPFLGLHYDLYLEEEIPNVNSNYVAGMSSDKSVCVGSFSEFGGTQTPITDLGATPIADVTNPAFPTSVTLTGPDTVTVGQSAQYSGIVNMGATVAPAGTQVEVSSPNGTMVVSTQADGSFNTTLSFPNVGPQLIAVKAGIGTASQTVTVTASTPAQIILTNTSGGGGGTHTSSFRRQSVTANPANYQATIGTPVTIQGLVADVNGNPIPLSVMNVTSDTPDVPTQTLKTNNQGSFNLTYTPKSIGMKQITLTIGSAMTTASVNVLQGDPQMITLQSSVGAVYSSDPLTITAGQAINLKGRVAGLYDSPVEGVTIAIDSPTNGVDNFAPNGTITTDESGSYTSSNIVLSQSGTQKIQATTAGINTPAQIQVNVTPGAAAQVANLSANPTQVGAGGAITVIGQILDGYGNPVQTGTAIALVGPDEITKVTTQSGGQFVTTQKVSTPGMAALKVQSAGTTLNGGTVAINVLPTGAYSLTINTSVSQIVTGESLTATITLKDNTGALISGKSMTLSNTPEASALATTQVTTDAGGQAIVTIGPVTKVGYESITATMDGVSNVIGTATFQVLPGAPNLVIANVSPSTAQVWTVADPVAQPIVNGTLYDEYGNTVPDAPVTLSGGYGANTSGITNANGNFAITIKPTNIGGPFPITVISGLWSDTPAGLTISVTTLVSYSMTLSFNQPLVTVGQSVTATATIKDARGNPVSGLELQFSSPSQSAAVISTPDITNGNGQTTINVTYTKVGQQVLVGTYQNVQASASVTVNSVDPATDSFLHVAGLTLSPNVIVINPSHGPIVTGTLLDSYNNPVSNTMVTVSGGWGASSTGTTSAAGVFTMTLTPTNTGTFGLTISSGLFSDTYSTSELTLTVTATQGYQLSVTTPASAPAGIPVTATATLLDQVGNAVSGATLVFDSPTGPAIISTPNPTDSSGRTTVQVSWEKATTQIIQASYLSNVHASSAVAVTPGSPTFVNATVSPFTTVQWTEANPVPLPIVSGTLTDSYANPVIGADLTVSGGYGASATGTTGANGYFAIAISPTTLGGPFPITLSSGTWSETVGNLTVIPKPPTLTVTLLNGTAIADVNIPYSILATLTDSDGIPITGVPVNLDIQTDVAAVYSKSINTDSSGSALFTVKFSKVSNQRLNFSCAANGKNLNSTVYLYSAVPILGNFVYQSVIPTSVQAGNTLNVSGFVYNQFGNPMPTNTGVSVTLPGSNASTVIAYTASNGSFSASITPTKAGGYTLGCTVGSSTFNYGTPISVTAGTPTTGTLTNSLASVQSGNSNTANIQLFDPWNNKVPNANVTLGTNDPTITVNQPPKTDVNGMTLVSVGPFNTVGTYHFYTTSPISLTSTNFNVYDTKYVTATGSSYSSSGSVPSTYYYNSGGYLGTLNLNSIGSYLGSGGYVPSDSYTASSSSSGTAYKDDMGIVDYPVSSIYYNSGGYSGTLSLNSVNGSWVFLYHNGIWGDCYSMSYTATYSGTVTRPGYDTSVYYYYGNYSGYATKS